MKRQLIRLGSRNPHLRHHIAKILGAMKTSFRHERPDPRRLKFLERGELEDLLEFQDLEPLGPGQKKVTARYKTSHWVELKNFFPTVRNPLFHGTTGVRVNEILEKGIRTDIGMSNQLGISLARSPIPLLEGAFGNAILILDGDLIRRNFRYTPHSDDRIFADEMEDRIHTDHIPVSMIRGVAFIGHVEKVERRFLARQSRDKWQAPVIFKNRDGSWTSSEEYLET